MQRFFAADESVRDRALFGVISHGGLRGDEAAPLTTDDVFSIDIDLKRPVMVRVSCLMIDSDDGDPQVLLRLGGGSKGPSSPLLRSGKLYRLAPPWYNPSCQSGKHKGHAMPVRL
jgi:hypothetical protein